jgi:hypothetical protein
MEAKTGLVAAECQEAVRIAARSRARDIAVRGQRTRRRWSQRKG